MSFEAFVRRWRFWPRPPMSNFAQYSPRPIAYNRTADELTLTHPAPRIAIVTPSYNQGRYLDATITSVLSQKYPSLVYHVQDAASTDGTIDVLRRYGAGLSWRSEPDHGQADAINIGFALAGDCDVMAYLNSDDTLLPGTLAFVAHIFQTRPEIDIVYGHRIFIDEDGLDIGRAVFPPHDAHALGYIGYVPQETMFWRRRVWDRIGPFDNTLSFALDWDFMLRAQKVGFKMVRLPRFLGCFRIHNTQKTSAMIDVGMVEMQALRQKHLGHVPSRVDTYRAAGPFLVRQFVFHWLHRLGFITG